MNYRAKHIFYPSSKRRFRCHDDYYWASVLQVTICAVIHFHGYISRSSKNVVKADDWLKIYMLNPMLTGYSYDTILTLISSRFSPYNAVLVDKVQKLCIVSSLFK